MRLGAREVPCFAPEDALLAQCQASLKNGFNRSLAQLRWVCDIAALIRAERGLDWDGLLAHAHRCRSQRALLVCLDLAHALLGAPVPKPILRRSRRDPLARYLRRVLERRFACADPYQPIALSRQFFYASLLKEHRTDRWPYLARSLSTLIEPNERDRGCVRLPAGLDPLYYLIRPMRLSLAHIGRAARRQLGPVERRP